MWHFLKQILGKTYLLHLDGVFSHRTLIIGWKIIISRILANETILWVTVKIGLSCMPVKSLNFLIALIKLGGNYYQIN